MTKTPQTRLPSLESICCNMDATSDRGSSAPAASFEGTVCTVTCPVGHYNLQTLRQMDVKNSHQTNQCFLPQTQRFDVFYVLALVEHAHEPSGVAGRCHPDLLLPVCGLRGSHIIRKLQWRKVRPKKQLSFISDSRVMTCLTFVFSNSICQKQLRTGRSNCRYNK